MKFLFFIFISLEFTLGFENQSTILKFHNYLQDRETQETAKKYHQVDLANEKNSLFLAFKNLRNYLLHPGHNVHSVSQVDLELIYDFLRFYQGIRLSINPNTRSFQPVFERDAKEMAEKALVVFRTKTGFVEDLETNPFSSPTSFFSKFLKKYQKNLDQLGDLNRIYKFGKLLFKGASPVSLLLLTSQTIAKEFPSFPKELINTPVYSKEIDPSKLSDFLESIWLIKYAIILEALGFGDDQSLDKLSFRDLAYEYFEKNLNFFSGYLERLRISETGVFFYLHWLAIAGQEIAQILELESLRSHKGEVSFEVGKNIFLKSLAGDINFETDLWSKEKSDIGGFKDFLTWQLTKNGSNYSHKEQIAFTRAVLVTIAKEGFKNKRSKAQTIVSALGKAKLASKIGHALTSSYMSIPKLLGHVANFLSDQKIVKKTRMNHFFDLITEKTFALNFLTDNYIGSLSERVFLIYAKFESDVEKGSLTKNEFEKEFNKIGNPVQNILRKCREFLKK